MSNSESVFHQLIISRHTYFDDLPNVGCQDTGCGQDNVHFELPYVVPSHDNYEANWFGRGDLLAIPMWCECGTHWETCFGFHKGATTLFVRNISSPEGEDGYVYFIEEVGMHRIKIGHSMNPEQRLKQLSTGSSAHLRLLAACPGGKAHEKALHRKFSHLNIRGEWFHFTKELIEFVQNVDIAEASGFIDFHGPNMGRS